MFSKEEGPPELLGYEATLNLFPLLAVLAAALVLATLSCLCQKFCPKPKCFKINVSVFVFLIFGALGAIALAVSSLYYAEPPESSSLTCTIATATGEARISPAGSTEYHVAITAQYSGGPNGQRGSGTGVFTTESQDEYLEHTTVGRNVTCYVRDDDPTSLYFEPPKDESVVEYVVIASSGTILVMALIACCLSCGKHTRDDKVYSIRTKEQEMVKNGGSYDPFDTFEDRFVKKEAWGADTERKPSPPHVAMSRSHEKLLGDATTTSMGASQVSLSVPTPPDGADRLSAERSGIDASSAIGGPSPWAPRAPAALGVSQERKSKSQEVTGSTSTLQVPGFGQRKSTSNLPTFGAIANVVTAGVKMKQSTKTVARRSEHQFDY